MESISISIDAIHSYYTKEREIYSRMVFTLGMDPTRAMEIISFWLWVEDDSHVNIISQIYSFDDDTMLKVALVALNFVESLCLNHQSGVDDSFVNIQLNHKFRQKAICGINYFLTNVCYKTLDDIRRKAERDDEIRKMEVLVEQMSQIYLDCRSPNRRFKSDGDIINPFKDDAVRFSNFASLENHDFKMKNSHIGHLYVPHGEGTSRSGVRRKDSHEDSDMHRSWFHPDFIDIKTTSHVDYPFNIHFKNHTGNPKFQLENHIGSIPMVGASFDPHQIVLDDHLVNMGKNILQHYNPVRLESSLRSTGLCSQPQHNIPRDERTLFVTFSNGYPLTEDDLYSFFMRNYGDVESISIEETKEERPPLYAHVSFRSLDTILRILNGNVKVKFMTKGKHLWARRFIPKKKFKSNE
uniref:Uncharacterized protein LOC105057909 n=1 Tax=Elaeis guineensis var. tenera TaxID=51953 RepID=A0A6I9SG18_ELAGV|nr:uncharacterized protein LOC105057909 [Elaeis guineensis]